MKINRIFAFVAAGISLLSAQSCLKDQADIFPESSSERLQAYLDQARNTLVSAEKGWIMEYYPGSKQSKGGYAYHLVFSESEVTATCELDPDNSYTSVYKLTTDNGAVLSFDSYNSALHYFATPSSSEYQAKGGDFEFTITSVSPEKIGLRGKRSGNHYDLYPYDSDLTPAAYMAKVADMASSMRAAIIDGKVGETEVTGTVDFNNRRITFKYSDPNASSETNASVDEEGRIVIEAPFMYTPEGVKTYEPVEVAGCTINKMFYYSDNNILTNGSIMFNGKLPEDYTDYADFEGDYKLSMYNGKLTADVSLTPDEAMTGYVMSGFLPDDHDVTLGYDRARGRLTMDVQSLGSDGSNTVWLAAWSLSGGGNLTWDTTTGYGMEIVRNLDTGDFMFVDNGKTDMVIDSFILWATDASGNSAGQFKGWGNSQFPYLQTLTRK